ncbi:MAG: hypothetical protein P8Y97_11175 [Candidatus Lokiarchaeota archaeon]
MLQQIDISGIIQVFIVQLIIAIIFIIVGLKIIRNNKKRLNYTFSGFYFCVAIGALLNIVYSIIKIELPVLMLNFITNFFVSFGLIFIYSTNQIILKSSMVYDLKSQEKYMVLYGVLLILSIVFYFFGFGVTINASTNWKPNWHLFYYLYMNLIVTIFAIIPMLYTSLKIYKDFKDETLRKRWKYYLIGLIGLIVYMYGAFFNNLINMPIFRFVFSIFGLSVILWLILLYYGVGRQI